jgi:6-phosphofructokinase 1
MSLERGNKLGVLTSGGDAPGMNAAVRAVARVGMQLGLEVLGVEDGYAGLLEDRMAPVELRELDEASRRGGTLLGTARSKAFATPDGQAKAREVIARRGLRALVVIGGNGSLTGAHALVGAETPAGKLRVAGIPASIDNDLACTSMAVGVDTAMNTVVEACDRIFDTAAAHKRTFLVEVMGRDCGYLAMTAGIAAGADSVVVPEVGKGEPEIVQQILAAMDRAYGKGGDKRRVLVIKSEGVKIETARLKDLVESEATKLYPGVDTRVTVLGHVVRGGAPTAFDRLLGARLANAAVRALADGETDFMAGWVGPGIARKPCAYDPYVVLSPLDEVLAETAKLMKGESMLAQWRKRIYEEVEPILRQ